jgi:RNA polymerase sigma factor (sigma-70 family)
MFKEFVIEEPGLVITDDLIQQLRDHDESSFSLLFHNYGEKIYNLAYRMTGNDEDASDITQGTFLQVYRHIDSFRGDSHLYTWIFAIARNECLHVLKTRKRLSFVSFEELIQDAVSVVMPSGIAESEKTQLANQVKEGCLTGLIRCLSFNQRAAFILHVLLHLSIGDVAKILDKSETATRVLIHRARMNLKKFVCKNCSLYDSTNFCKCENLIGFSLKHGWILLNPTPTNGLLDTQKIEEEIQNFNSILNFYSNLNPPITPQLLHQEIRKLIASKDWELFNKSGV